MTEGRVSKDLFSLGKFPRQTSPIKISTLEIIMGMSLKS